MARLRMLLAEHDAPLRALLVRELTAVGYETIAVADGVGALRAARSGVDVAVIDAAMPAIDGLDIVRTLRCEGYRKPIAMLSGRSDDVERIVAYEVGVDDYVHKPFSPRELVARVRAIVRRSNIPHEGRPERLSFGRLEVDEPAREVRVDGAPVALKPREFGLFLALARHPGIAFSRGSLLERVWGFDFDGDERTVDVHMRRLRLKIEEHHGIPRCLLTVHGFGYKFTPTA
jgi:DNA-binding response OmpR family regulator